MLQFQIQTDSEIPASKQLFDQIRFAIASRQYPPGHRLPSTRQLAMITGLHRNTISKVYQQLEESGLVESQAGSGIYVKAQGHEGGNNSGSPILQQYPEAIKTVKKSIDELISQGFNLSQVKEFFSMEIDWRLRCSAQVLVTVPSLDIGAGELMVRELAQALGIPIQLVPMEDLPQLLKEISSGTIVTSRYFIPEVESISSGKSVRVVPVDIYDYSQELEHINKLPKDGSVGVVSLSPGILNIAEILIHSLRGEDLLIMTAQALDGMKLRGLVRTVHTIVCDRASYGLVKKAIATVRDDIIRIPDIICSQNYISEQSIEHLKRELGIPDEASAEDETIDI
jgi:GntR family transcriptional regulator